MFGHQLAGEVFFQELQKALARPDSSEVTDLLEVYQLCLLLGFKGKYAAGGAGELRSIMTTVNEKIHRVRGTSMLLSPRGTIPADAVRVVQADAWLRKLGYGSVALVCVAAVLFVMFTFVLMQGASELSSIASQALK